MKIASELRFCLNILIEEQSAAKKGLMVAIFTFFRTEMDFYYEICLSFELEKKCFVFVQYWDSLLI